MNEGVYECIGPGDTEGYGRDANVMKNVHSVAGIQRETRDTGNGASGDNNGGGWGSGRNDGELAIAEWIGSSGRVRLGVRFVSLCEVFFVRPRVSDTQPAHVFNHLYAAPPE